MLVTHRTSLVTVWALDAAGSLYLSNASIPRLGLCQASGYVSHWRAKQNA